MATGGKDRESRAARERARIYRARQDFHVAVQRRRTRDNVIAGVVGGIIALAAIGAQVVYFTAGPGAPEPAPSSTPTIPAPELSPSATSEPVEPTPVSTPAG